MTQIRSDRRHFLKMAGGLTAMAIASPLYRYAEQAWFEWSPSPLSPDAEMMWRKIATVILVGVLNDAPNAKQSLMSPQLTQWWQRFQQTVGVLPLSSQRELGQLVVSLTSPIMRRTVWGVQTDWQDANNDDIRGWLARCRYSAIPDIQSAYHAIHDLTLAAWYSDEAHWAAIDYQPPPYLFS